MSPHHHLNPNNPFKMDKLSPLKISEIKIYALPCKINNKIKNIIINMKLIRNLQAHNLS
jgi:hypothetical protein